MFGACPANGERHQLAIDEFLACKVARNMKDRWVSEYRIQYGPLTGNILYIVLISDIVELGCFDWHICRLIQRDEMRIPFDSAKM